MARQVRSFAPGEYYHLYNRGAHKFNIFRERIDFMRFLFLILYFQSTIPINNVSHSVRGGSVSDGFPMKLAQQEKIVENRLVELVAFCVMPNHFHILIKESEEGGISRYMQKITTAYTMYFNTKYSATGHVFQGRFQSVHIKDDRQLMHVSAYIHRNPRELAGWKGKEESYPYSSLPDYVEKNRWGNLIETDIIAGRFEATPKSNYRDFVRSSGAKELGEFEKL